MKNIKTFEISLKNNHQKPNSLNPPQIESIPGIYVTNLEFKKLLNIFLNIFSSTTQKTYLKEIKLFFKFLKEKYNQDIDFKKISKQDTLNYRDYLLQSNYANKTIRKKSISYFHSLIF
jgi:hypothetical protein